MTLNNVSFGRNIFCGPSSISAITGVNTDIAEQVIQDITGQRRNVKGVYLTDLCEAFRRLKYKTTYLTHLNNSGTLFYILTVLDDGKYIICVPNHFITIEVEGKNRYICDNHTKRPINVCGSARLSQRVINVVRVDKME